MTFITHAIHAFRPFRRSLPCAMLAALFLFPAGAALATPPLTISLSSEASHPAANDLMQATLFAEATGAALGDLSKRVNQTVADALKAARDYPAVKVKSGGTSTYPVYAKKGRIESWSIRSDISLESGDTAALSELIGKLQASLAVSGLRLLPSPETRRKAEDAAILDAIALFKERAKLVADAQGKNYAIRELTVSTGRSSPPMRTIMAESASFVSASAAPMPVEAGESLISASISGKIEIE
jgi:predicted secreted protein